ncbi:MAG: Molecular chaperone Hsp70 [Actinomycetia bacterium]|nr:Molecular chaperone Hsp70 [Actinomycetes bacterium]
MGMLKNLPPNLPHLSPIDVTFFMSETGLLTVRAVGQGSGTEVEFDLQIGDLNCGRDEQGPAGRRPVPRHRLSTSARGGSRYIVSSGSGHGNSGLPELAWTGTRQRRRVRDA